MNRLTTDDRRQTTLFQFIFILLLVVSCLSLVSASHALAADPPKPTDYTLLAPIPLDGAGGGVSEKANASTFIPGLFKLIIGIATALAVITIMFGGVQYIATAGSEGKGDAKKTIENALWGLLLALSAWLILNTINPKLIDFTLKIPVQEIEGPVTTPIIGGIDTGEACAGCVTVTVPHKEAPLGCAAPGPCQVIGELNARLIGLNKLQPFLVTESYPPTRSHENPCHANGTCVDATIGSANELNIKKFIENANKIGLNAQFETTTEKRAEDIRKATGLSKSQVYYVAGITGEHFSIYQ